MFESKIKSFLDYKSPYGEEGNTTPSRSTVNKALEVLGVIFRYKPLPNDVFRTSEGGIAFHYNLDKYYIIEVFPDDDLLLSIEEKDGWPQYKEIGLDNLKSFCSFLN